MNHRYSGVAILALLLGACGAAGNPGDPDETPVPLDQLPRQFADELCDAIAPCCAAGNVAYDATTCKNTASEVYQLFVTTNGGTNTKFDPVASRACLSGLKSVLESCAALVPSVGSVACDNIFDGTLPAGAECNGPMCANQTPALADGRVGKRADGASCTSHGDCSSNRCSGQGVCASMARPETCMGDFYNQPGGS